MVSSENRHLWRDCGLDGVRGVEDLDDAVEAALGGETAEDAPERLAGLFGLDAAALERRTGVPVAPEVAAARHGLIVAALARCRAAAEAPQEAAALRHALAVCAALQHETLGETQASEAALARREAAEPSAQLLAQALRGALPRGTRAALAAVRALAAAENAADLTLSLAVAELPLADALPLPVAEAADAAAVAARAVLAGFIGVVALADRAESASPAASVDGGCVSAAARALAAKGGSPLAAEAVARHLTAALPELLSGPADAAGRAAWRALAARPEFRVAAPLVLAPARLAWRIGGAPETGSLAMPLRAALRRGGAVRAAALSDLRAASAVLAVLGCLADAGLITGRLPEDPTARAAFAVGGRTADSIGCGAAARRFDRGNAFGALLGLAADSATLLAYRRGVAHAASGTVPFDWLFVPPADDAPLDLAAAAAVCALPLLDRRVVRGLGGVVRALLLPEEAALPETLPGPRAAPLPEEWARLFDRLWAETAGLSASAGPRVNLWGEAVGRPEGGVSAWASPAHDAAGGLSACGRLLLALGQPVAMPPRGATQGEAAYWRYAAAAGAAFRAEVKAILEGGHALSPAFAKAAKDPDLQCLILRRLAARAADAARRTLPPAAPEGLLRLA